MGIEIGLTCGCVFTAGCDVFHTGIHTGSEAAEVSAVVAAIHIEIRQPFMGQLLGVLPFLSPIT